VVRSRSEGRDGECDKKSPGSASLCEPGIARGLLTRALLLDCVKSAGIHQLGPRPQGFSWMSLIEKPLQSR
jgi:hypothetical protein